MPRDTSNLTRRGSTWWLDVRVPKSSGVPMDRIRCSLRTSSLPEAIRIRDQTLRPLLSAGGRHAFLAELVRQLCSSSDEVRACVAQLAAAAETQQIAGIRSSVLQAYPLERLLTEYIAYLRKTNSLSAGSTTKYNSSVRVWTYLLGANRDAQVISQQDVSQARDKLLQMPRSFFIRSAATRIRDLQPGEKAISATTIASHLRVLDAAYEWGLADGRIQGHNPAEKVKIKVGEATAKRLPTPAIADALCAMNKTTRRVGDDEWYYVPLILRYTGARFGEIVGLRGEDIVTENGIRCIHINAYHRRLKNKQSARLVPVPDCLAPIIDELLEKKGRGRFFPAAGDSKDGNKLGNTMNGKWNAAAKKIGPYSIHCFRVYANHHMTQAGVDIIDRERLLGHKSRSTQSAYTPRDLVRYKQAIDTIKAQELLAVTNATGNG